MLFRHFLVTSFILVSRDVIQPIRAQDTTTTDSTDSASQSRSQSQYDAYRLYEDMFVYDVYGKYRKQVRPVNDYDSGLDVEIRFNLLSLIDVNSQAQTLEVVAELQFEWVDSFLVWNMSDYGGIDTLIVELVTDVSFSYEIQLYIDSQQGIDTSNYNEDGTWTLMDTFAQNIGQDSWEDRKSKITYSILLERKNTFYIVSIILPVLFLTMTSSLVFALPADSGEKMSTGLTVLLAYAVYLTIISDYLPDTSTETSYLALTLTILLGYTALSVIITAFTLRIHHKPTDREPVGPKVKALTNFLQKIMCKHYGRRSRESAYRDSSSRSKKDDFQQPDYRLGVEHMYLGRRGNHPLQNMPVGGQSALPSRRQNPGNHVNPVNHINHAYDNHLESQYLNESRDQQARDPHPADEQNEHGHTDDMDWPEVAKTVDWFFFILSCFFTFVTVFGCIALLIVGASNTKPSIGPAT